MNKNILKPSLSKIVASWLLVTFVVLLFTLPFNLQKLTSVVVFVTTIVFALLKTLILTVVFYSLPSFRIEITDSHIVGLRSFASWERAKIPIKDIDTLDVNEKFKWLGYYGLKSKTNQKMLVCAFDEKQFRKLITILNEKKQFI